MADIFNTHYWPWNQMADIFNNNIYIYIAGGCSLQSKLKNVSVGLDVDLALFSRQATAGTSDDIDHRRIYASPELSSHIAPLYDNRKISLCICICFIQCHYYVWFDMYICSIIVLRNTSLLLSFLSWTIFIGVFYVSLSYHCHVAYLFPCVLKVGD